MTVASVFILLAITCNVLTFARAGTLVPLKQNNSSDAGMVKTVESKLGIGSNSVCYGDLGCFPIGSPWNAAGRVALPPEKPEKINTQFLLYTKKNINDPFQFKAGDVEALKKSNFNGSKKTKFTVHGFLDWATRGWQKEIAKQFLNKEDANVFAVDWQGGSQTIYGQATANTRVVGAEIAKMIKFLSSQSNLKLEDVHIIGHSLGAHITGYAGANLNGKVGRITGMDPAGPYFKDTDRQVRLDETDGQFVDILHTDSGDGKILQVVNTQGDQLGTWQPSGHVDVFLNSGKDQPGCKKIGQLLFRSLFSDVVSIIANQVTQTIACSHCRAYDYMTETISSSCPWRSYKCADWNEFKTGRCLQCPASDTGNVSCNGVGYRAVKPSDGSVNNKYWSVTGDKAPFCRYHYHIQVLTSTKDNKDQKGRFWFKLVGDKASTTSTLVTEEYSLIKANSTLDFLVTSTTDLVTILSIEAKWEHDASWYTNAQLQSGKPTFYLKKVSVFSGEYQTESSFCDNNNNNTARQSITPFILSTRC